MSRELHPKQFHSLVAEESMLQQTVQRLTHVPGLAPPIIICNNEHRFVVAEQVRQIGVEPSAIYLEPVGRNTAPAIAVAAQSALQQDADAMIFVLPADHVIDADDQFKQAIHAAEQCARADYLVSFGIKPNRAETGYGYIRSGKALAEIDSPAYVIDEFVEKPDAATAESYLASGEYLWNSGMFMFRADRYLQELERFEPEMLTCCQRAFQACQRDLDFIRIDEQQFARCPSNSIDYAVMEKSQKTAVVPFAGAWSDVGSWSSLWEIGQQDARGNVLHGDVVHLDVDNSYVSSQGRLIAAIGLDNHIVVETDDAVLVANKDRAQDVKNIVSLLKDAQRDESVVHKRVHRPWGCFQGIDVGDRFQVKRLVVSPGKKLSLQLHHKRSEHWVVVKGKARVTRDDEVFELSEDQSTYIPVGTRHRLENIGNGPLELIEVQTGSYLGEDDIVRFDDVFGRAGGDA
jgi:mannose-1-phosphate guanylyltransferase/mannose-6-phosphate isomerase